MGQGAVGHPFFCHAPTLSTKTHLNKACLAALSIGDSATTPCSLFYLISSWFCDLKRFLFDLGGQAVHCRSELWGKGPMVLHAPNDRPLRYN